MLYYLPPDYDDPWEWRIAQNLAQALTRAQSWEGLAAIMLAAGVLLGFILLKLAFLTLRRLWDIYRSRANDTTTSGKTLKWSGIGLLIITVLALLLGSQPGMEGIAFLVFAVSLFLFTIISEVVNYYQARQEATEPLALPENISIHDVITWKNQVDAAPAVIPRS
jgi:multisubunit Na+/H+ antiporter MnhG subunit